MRVAERRAKIKQVDVFTTVPFTGNPAAVVLDAAGLSDEQMAAIAREMNLSETTFVLPPTDRAADYRVRFFGLRSELPFAGHPTIATVCAVIEEGAVYRGRVPELVRQESGIGVMPIAVEKKPQGLSYLMTQAAPEWEETSIDRAQASQLLGCAIEEVVDLPMQIVSTGVRWLIIPLASLSTIKALKPNMGLIEQASRQYKAYGVTTFSLQAEYEGHRVRARTFAPAAGVLEDPVCGTGNGSIAAYIAKHQLMSGDRFDYVAEQGYEVSRPGLVTVRAQLSSAGWSIQIGGQAVSVLEGTLAL